MSAPKESAITRQNGKISETKKLDNTDKVNKVNLKQNDAITR